MRPKRKTALQAIFLAFLCLGVQAKFHPQPAVKRARDPTNLEAEIPEEEGYLQHGSSDIFCPDSDGETCNVSGPYFFSSNISYTTNESMVLDNAQLICATATTPSITCGFYITLTGNGTTFSMSNSFITGLQIVIVAEDSQIIIDESSVLTVEGKSFYTFGTSSSGNSGASFVSQGGYCSGTPSTTYGSFKMVPSHKPASIGSQIGSAGATNDGTVYGGGRVVIFADSIQLNGTIDADGIAYNPTQDPENGGSGGYVYIQTYEEFNNNSIGDAALLTAKGANGLDGGYGGSGGIIYLWNFNLPTEQMNAKGGGTDASDSCYLGGPGTIYYHDEDLLIVDNQGQTSTASMPFYENSSGTYLSNMVVTNGANVQVLGSELILLNSFSLTNSGKFQIGEAQDNVTFTVYDSFDLDTTSVFDLVTNVQNTSISLLGEGSSYTVQELTFNLTLYIYADTIQVEGDLSPVDPTNFHTALNLEGNTLLQIDQDVELSAVMVTLKCAGDIDIGEDTAITAINQQQYVLPGAALVNNTLQIASSAGWVRLNGSALTAPQGILVAANLSDVNITNSNINATQRTSSNEAFVFVIAGGTVNAPFNLEITATRILILGEQLINITEDAYFNALTAAETSSTILNNNSILLDSYGDIFLAYSTLQGERGITLQGVNLNLTQASIEGSSTGAEYDVYLNASEEIWFEQVTVVGAGITFWAQGDISIDQSSLIYLQVLSSSLLRAPEALEQSYEDFAEFCANPIAQMDYGLVFQSNGTVYLGSLSLSSYGYFVLCSQVADMESVQMANPYDNATVLFIVQDGIYQQDSSIDAGNIYYYTKAEISLNDTELSADVGTSSKNYSLVLYSGTGTALNNTFLESSNGIDLVSGGSINLEFVNFQSYSSSQKGHDIGIYTEMGLFCFQCMMAGEIGLTMNSQQYVLITGGDLLWTDTSIVIYNNGTSVFLTDSYLEATNIKVISRGDLQMMGSTFTIDTDTVKLRRYDVTFHAGGMFAANGTTVNSVSGTHVIATNMSIENCTLNTTDFPDTNITLSSSEGLYITNWSTIFASVIHIISEDMVVLDNVTALTVFPILTESAEFLISQPEEYIGFNLTINGTNSLQISNSFLFDELGICLNASTIEVHDSHLEAGPNTLEESLILFLGYDSIVLSNTSVLAIKTHILSDDGIQIIEGSSLQQQYSGDLRSSLLYEDRYIQNHQNLQGGINASSFPVLLYAPSGTVAIQDSSLAVDFGVFIQSFMTFVRNSRLTGLSSSSQSTLLLALSSYYMLFASSDISFDQVFMQAPELIQIAAYSQINTSNVDPTNNNFYNFIESFWNASYANCSSEPVSDFGLQLQSSGFITIKDSNISSPKGYYSCGEETYLANASMDIMSSSFGANFSLSSLSDFETARSTQISAGLLNLWVNGSMELVNTTLTQSVNQNAGAEGPIVLTCPENITISSLTINSIASVSLSAANVNASGLEIYVDPAEGALAQVTITAEEEVTLDSNSYIDAQTIAIKGLESLSVSSSQFIATEATLPLDNSITIESYGSIYFENSEMQAQNGFLLISASFAFYGVLVNASNENGYYDVNLVSNGTASLASCQIIGEDINIVSYHQLIINSTPLTSYKMYTNQPEEPTLYQKYSFPDYNEYSEDYSDEYSDQYSEYSHKNSDETSEESEYLARQLRTFGKVYQQQRRLSSLKKQKLQSNISYEDQYHLLVELVPQYSIHLASYGAVFLYNSPVSCPTGMGIFGNSIDLTISPISALLAGANALLIAQYTFRAKSSKIMAAQLLVQGPASLTMIDGSGFESTLSNSCNLDTSSDENLFQCVPMGAQYSELSAEQVIDNFNAQFGTTFTSEQQLYPSLMANFTLFLLTYGNFTGSYSNFIAPRQSFCASNVSFSQTFINSTGRGCISDTGLGAGVLTEGCAGSGASHGGMGGYGSSDTDDLQGVAACTADIPAPYTSQGDEVMYEGSGGASGVAGSHYGGNGGGVIWIQSTYNMLLRVTKVEADGKNGIQPQSSLLAQSSTTYGSGGGSGGSIMIITNILQGDGILSAEGGQGSAGGGGGGAGGKMLIFYLKNIQSGEINSHTYNWEGTQDMNGGDGGSTTLESQSEAGAGQTGTIYRPKCQPGYSGAMCSPCPEGTFKYGFSYGACLRCNSAPENAYYYQKAWYNADCPYECDEGLEAVDVNPDCLNSLELSLQRLGAEYQLLIFTTIFVVLTLMMWMCLINQSQKITKSIQARKSKMYKEFERFEAEQKNGNEMIGVEKEVIEHELETSRRTQSEHQRIGRLLQKSMVKQDVELKDANMYYHLHRIYLIGDNTITFPWGLPEDFPSGRVFKEDEARIMDQVIDQHQEEFQWTKPQTLTYLLFRFLYPPFAAVYHKKIRSQHYQQFKAVMEQNFDETFWNDSVGNSSMRVLCTKNDHTVCHLDFLDYYKTFEEYQGPALPMTMLVSGLGSFNSPYHLNHMDDPYIKQIVLFNYKFLKDKLPIYFDYLNGLLHKLSFLSFTGQILKDLDQVVEWVEYGNEHIFSALNLKLTLYLFENMYKTSENSLQKRRSFPMDQMLLNSFPHAFKKLIRFVKYKKFTKRSEIRLGLVLSKLDKEKQLKSQEKIQHLAQKLKVNEMFVDKEDIEIDELEQRAQNFSIQRWDYISDCLSDFYEDSEIDHEPIRRSKSKDKGKVSPNINETEVEEKEVKEKYQLSRAYSISQDSAQNLEKAINKERVRCQHKIDAFNARLYSLYLLLLKFSSKPPKQNLYVLFMFYAGFIALDLLLLFNFVMYLFYPIQNLYTLGIPFLLVFPGIPIFAPIVGIVGIINGSQHTMQQYAEYNALQFMVNLPLTLLALIIMGDQYYYDLVISLLILNKICLSFTNGLVRAHFRYPSFKKQIYKLDAIFGLNLETEYEETRPRSGSLRSNPRISDGEDSDEERLDSRAKGHIEEEIKEDLKGSLQDALLDD